MTLRFSRPLRVSLRTRGSALAAAHVPPTTRPPKGASRWREWSPEDFVDRPRLELAPPCTAPRVTVSKNFGSSAVAAAEGAANKAQRSDAALFWGTPVREGGRGPQLSTGIGCRVFFCSNASAILAGPEKAPKPAAAEAEGSFFLLNGRFNSLRKSWKAAGMSSRPGWPESCTSWIVSSSNTSSAGLYVSKMTSAFKPSCISIGGAEPLDELPRVLLLPPVPALLVSGWGR